MKRSHKVQTPRRREASREADAESSSPAAPPSPLKRHPYLLAASGIAVALWIAFLIWMAATS